ncbi:putative ammonia monooxygenase [Saccharomonospora marina XMU15]|uniref:Putative ammonia monooxygenase n=1 Tax=Saccharomonospora marina XMU15 TaxID=882083 RepID=H5X428_9PSEU|nr:AbrB family transcriptional regulator [Saccharomonospora marina]EHR53299.1 putative ammonia monooxygenase [Saccharomonospora marina XMU15]
MNRSAGHRWWADAGRLAQLLTGALAGAAVFSLLRIPAAVLVGSVVGSAVANRVRTAEFRHPAVGRGVRTVALVVLGSVAGARLDTTTLHRIGALALPLACGIALLLALEAGLAALLIARYRIDPVTALLSCAPGGVSEIALTGRDLGARMGVVLAVHMTRVLAVVLVVLPVLVAWSGAR